MNIEKAIELLKKEYERAKRLDYVRNPLAYALYQVWKVADKKGVKKIMTDNEKMYVGLSPIEQLNAYRNLYYNDGNTTEKGIIANAINDMFAEFTAKSQRLRDYKNCLDDKCDRCIERDKKEAYKEFAEKLKRKSLTKWDYHEAVDIEDIDKLLKEMVGENSDL